MTSLLPDSKNGDTVNGLGYRNGSSGCRKKATRKVGNNVRSINIERVISAFSKRSLGTFSNDPKILIIYPHIADINIMNTQVLKTQTYAELVNSQFDRTSSYYVTVAQRLKSALANNASATRIVNQAVMDFSTNHPNTKWEDFKFCKTQKAQLSLIDIDITLQRFALMTHCINIINGFKQVMVMPISVYEDATNPGRYVCWDGQHTAISLYIIASMVYNKSLDEIYVPIVVYDSSLKSEMRESFITLNSVGKVPLDSIDLYQLKIFGVRTDGSTNSDWVATEQKQTALEQNFMFATNEKFGDDMQPGAFSRLVELTSNKYPVEVTQHFAKYFFSVCNSSRPVEPKESWMLYDLFDQCLKQRIKVDDAYISGIAASLRKAFNNNFSSSVLFTRATSSYEEWFRSSRPNPDGSLDGIYRNDKNIGMPFFIEQLRKNFKGPLPFWPATKPWVVPKADLF